MFDLTNRDLLKKAMPLKSITRKQWNAILALADGLSETDLSIALNTMISNKAKIEIISNYSFYYSQELDKPVSDSSITGLMTV